MNKNDSMILQERTYTAKQLVEEGYCDSERTAARIIGEHGQKGQRGGQHGSFAGYITEGQLSKYINRQEQKEVAIAEKRALQLTEKHTGTELGTALAIKAEQQLDLDGLYNLQAMINNLVIGKQKDVIKEKDSRIAELERAVIIKSNECAMIAEQKEKEKRQLAGATQKQLNEFYKQLKQQGKNKEWQAGLYAEAKNDND